ncbi:ribosomal protein S18-alanine N-acetyltransferase [Rhodococcus marinonascens]|uniref:ribosomal protein S18-alanine N-acetyltransferase n=1 Tax=Rhodococcus marinonascens TaxID=38311 RepID=UPI00093408AC|nr:ribosomal protein S18-alanine N-acetyltransferase [Rhodococcus marinonascens]
MTFRIEPMAGADAERCAELEVLLFTGDGPWSAEAFRAELVAPHAHYTVARDDVGQLVGYAGIALLGNSSQPESEIHTIGTDPACRRRGVGRALLDELLRRADAHGGPVYLEVRTDNDAAIALYRHVGFEIVGTRKKYYQPSGADAFTMRRSGSREEQVQ